MKGVTQDKRGFWYAYVNGGRQYFGKGNKAHKAATAAKGKEIAAKHENREIAAGLRVKRNHFKNFKALAEWYMQLPSVEQKKSYDRKIYSYQHLAYWSIAVGQFPSLLCMQLFLPDSQDKQGDAIAAEMA